jgi:hypothetical protein
MGAYILTAFVNPGLPKKNLSLKYCNSVDYKNFRVCGICNTIMNLDEGTSHCEDCNVCVEGKNIYRKFFYNFNLLNFFYNSYL